MFVPLFVAVAYLAPQPAIDRDAFGVPHIQASHYDDAFFQAGYAVAQDRLHQMDTSRHLARGRLAEFIGPSAVASDREIRLTGYSDPELHAQYQRLSPNARTAMVAYAKGVNAWIRQTGSAIEAWSVLDSVAITIHLLQQFGRGGAGELRNMAALQYLQGRKEIGTRALDVFDDIAWFNDPQAQTTLSDEDDVLSNSHPRFEAPTRDVSLAHLSKLPKVGLFELLGAIRTSERQASSLLAEKVSAPFRTGSYCVVVGPNRSKRGEAMLLSGPQMGLRTPSIAHEISIDAPGLSIAGMDIPGVPGVIVGETRHFAWGITSGVADTDDILFYPSDGLTYEWGDKRLPLNKTSTTIKVLGGKDQKFDQVRTLDGPVILQSKGGHVVFAKKSGYWMHELDTFDAWVQLWGSTSPDSIERSMDRATMNFNFFYATTEGDIGWKYLGRIPIRAEGIDPRFPTPGQPAFAWKSILSPGEMPHVRNPKSGLLTNWNNKPVSWWPNWDTPAWGTISESDLLNQAASASKMSREDLERVPEVIAKGDPSWNPFKPYLSGTSLKEFDGRLVEGSIYASLLIGFERHLREELFLQTTGNFLSSEYFNLVLQPTVVLKALKGETHFDYLGGRTTMEVVSRAFERAKADSYREFHADSFKTYDPEPVLYSNRGTYIQLITLSPSSPMGESVLPPGVSEDGIHRNDQSTLAREWRFKPMLRAIGGR